jgi:hypothetical protein
MKLIQFGVRDDYGKEYYMTLCTTKELFTSSSGS